MSNLNKIKEITDQLDKKIPDIMVVRLPKFRVVTTGAQTWDNWNKFDELMGWGWHEDRKGFFKDIIFNCIDLLQFSDSGFEYILSVKDHVTEADASPWNIIEFPGGLYAMAVSIDDDDESRQKVDGKMYKWLESTNFEFDGERKVMGAMAYEGGDVKEGLGYTQFPRFIPIKVKDGKPVELPYELKLPLNDGEWTYWEPSLNYIRAAKKMVVEYEGERTWDYSFVRQNPSPWEQYDNGSDVITEEPGKLILDLRKTQGNRLGFAIWEKGASAKVKRIYLI
jgi:hypothetical protein